MRNFPLVVALLLCLLLVSHGQAADDPLASLRPGHPRLIAAPDSWAQVKLARGRDPILAEFCSRIVRGADAVLPKPPSTYHKIGRRLLDVSRETERRILLLAAAYQLTDDPRYVRRAETEMLAVARFSDWNPSHFLDVGEMTATLALGYDWLYADLTPDARVAIRQAIVEKGLRVGMTPHAKYNGWQTVENNWNQVCWGGMILGALAVADEQPELARRVLTLARPNLVHGLKPYAPDGVPPEGPGYWSYGTTYSVLTVAALESALGTDWGLRDSPGLVASVRAFLQENAPSGLYFDYSDCGEKGSFEPAVFWFAATTGDAGLVVPELQRLRPAPGQTALPGGEAGRFVPLAALWWPKAPIPATPALPLHWHGRGDQNVAVFRSSWTDPRALYVAVKGGSASLNHAHMDAGSFVFESDGVRWARDLGMQSYETLESKGVDLWNRAQASQRWTVFRLNNRSHNTLTIDGALHRVAGEAVITKFLGEGNTPEAVIDLTAVFAGQAARVTRGFRVLDHRSVYIRDELEGLKPGADVCWTMVTAAEATVATPDRAVVLRENGQTLHVRALGPSDARLDVVPADPPADGYNAANPNRRKVEIHTTAPADGRVNLCVWLTPDGTEPAPAFGPLASW